MCSKCLAICSNWSATFSRMRSEGFPFIVVVGSVTSLLYGRRDAQCNKIISFKVWKVEEASHEMLVLALQTLKMGSDFRVLSGRRNTLEACQRKRVVFSWQAQHFAIRRFALVWQALHFVTWRKWFFYEPQCQGCANKTQCQKSWQAQHIVTALKSGASLAKNHTLAAVWK